MYSEQCLADILKEKEAGEIVHSRRVYNDGSHVDNGVSQGHLKEHIEYNRVYRFGCALFIDGKCVNLGYLSEERCAAIAKELQENPVKMKRCTVPYS